MSMLTAQVEILRDRAHELCMLADGLSAPYVIPSTKETMFLAMKSAASEMREAADTIESLRDRLQEAGNVDAERDAIFAKAIRRIVEKNTDFNIVDIEESHS